MGDRKKNHGYHNVIIVQFWDESTKFNVLQKLKSRSNSFNVDLDGIEGATKVRITADRTRDQREQAKQFYQNKIAAAAGSGSSDWLGQESDR